MHCQGDSIENILLDFTGGFLSLGQALLDNGIKGDWAQVMGGNPAKFFLGFASMFYDVVFMVQHYYLYAANNAQLEQQEAAHRAATEYAALRPAIESEILKRVVV